MIVIKVSVIVPVYNTEKYLSKCFDSIINQTLRDIEIIIVDDSSPDNSFEIIKKYSDVDSRIKYFRHKENAGLGSSRNRGMLEASGKYISFVDSDDFINRRMLEKLYNAAERYSANMAICSCRYYWDKTGNYTSKMGEYYNISHIKSGSVLTPNIPCPSVAWSKLYKKFDIIASEILFPSNLCHEDEMFHFCYLAKVRPIVAVVDEPLYSYRMRDNSEQITANPNSRLDIPAVYSAIAQYLNKQNLLHKYTEDLLVLMENSLSYRGYNLNLKLRYQFYRETRNLLLSLNVKPAWLIEKRCLHILLFDYDLNYINSRCCKFDSIKISIVIPVYATEQYLTRCIDSVINQTYKNIEIIIVNDASPGNCVEIVESYKKIDSKIIYIEHEKNQSPLIARKTAIEKCSGDYTIFLDSDDSLELNACQILVDNLMKEKSDIIHFGANVISDDKDAVAWLESHLAAKHASLYGASIFNNLINDGCSHNLCGKCFYTPVLKIANTYIEMFYSIHAEDLYACYIIFYFANEYFSIENKLYNYYIESGGITQKMKSNISLEKWDRLCKSTSDAIKYLYKFFVNVGIENIYAIEFSKLASGQFDNLEKHIDMKTKSTMYNEYTKVYAQYLDMNYFYTYQIKFRYNKEIEEIEFAKKFKSIIDDVKRENEEICSQILPYFFSIIRNSKYLIIRIFGIKIIIKNKKQYNRMLVITGSGILRAIFSLSLENKKYIVLRLFGFKIHLKTKNYN